MKSRVRLLGVASALPELVRTSEDVEKILSESGGFMPRKGFIETMSGISQRRVASDDIQCSDLAAAACRKVLEKTNVSRNDIDLLIYASACQDLVEPATSHIVQSKLGTNCPVFDVKNACNSYLNAVQLAESLILGGTYKKILLAVGEVSSRGVSWRPKNLSEFKNYMPGYTMGDAGAAALFAASSDGSGIYFQEFSSLSNHWELTTVYGGGSMFPRGAGHMYIRTNAPKLKLAFREIGLPFLEGAMKKANARYTDFKRIFVHQVSLPYLHDMLRESGIPVDKVEVTIDRLGNIAAASIPVAMAKAIDRGDVGRGDRVMCLGLASGISIGVLMMDL